MDSNPHSTAIGPGFHDKTHGPWLASHGFTSGDAKSLGIPPRGPQIVCYLKRGNMMIISWNWERSRDIQSYFLDGLVEKNEDATWFFTTKRVQTWRQPQKIGCFGTEQWRKGADAKHSFTNFTDPTVLNPSGTSGLIFSGWGAPVVHRLPAVMNSSSSFGVLHSS